MRPNESGLDGKSTQGQNQEEGEGSCAEEPAYGRLATATTSAATAAHSHSRSNGSGHRNGGSNTETHRQGGMQRGSRGGWVQTGESEGVFHGTLSYMPRQQKLGRAGIGTFRAVEGCQRVREPVLSPLLYKSYENYSAASRGVPCWCCKCIAGFDICNRLAKYFFGAGVAGLLNNYRQKVLV